MSPQNSVRDRLLSSTPSALGSIQTYPSSWVGADAAALAIARVGGTKCLLAAASTAAALPADLQGDEQRLEQLAVRLCPLSHDNAAALRRLVPWTAPVSLRERTTTIGCGDRLGRATPGHLRAARRFDVAPVLAQQSIRELTLTGRTYENVVDDVTFLVLQEGYDKGYGADGDHLKTLADINTAIDAGMAMITLDLTEKMHPEAESWSAAQVEAGFAHLADSVQRRILDTYAGQTFDVDGECITIAPTEAKRCAIMYLQAMDFARDVHDLLCRRRGRAFDLEISIDETQAPTLPAHHLFIIRELLHRDIGVTSLAPRFIGEFQKAIDYIGDLAEFERQFRVHCAIATCYGGYKISIHSGSDKFSAYPIIGRHTNHRVHVKTAGTSWLEAVRAVAQCNPSLYREMHAKAFAVLPEALKLYHITPELARIPPLESLPDERLAELMNQDDARQLLHVTYGGILSDTDLKDRFCATLDAAEEVYYEVLERHFVRHLSTLGLSES